MRIIRNFDVRSYYPSLMIENGYTSRNIPSPEVFEKVYWDRVAAKKAGDKVKDKGLKLILNTTYGASLASTNPLYDPLMGRSVCISGQLYLLELAMRLYQEIPELEIVQLNTDGITIEFDDSQYDAVMAIINEWQERTHFVLEEDKIKRLIQKDVNNYFLMFESGKIKTKGAYFSSGIAPAGAFSINNNFVIVKDAVVNYFVNSTPVEDTILSCEDIHKFQIIAKAGGGYKAVYHIPDDFDAYRKQWVKENRFKVNGKWVNPIFRWENYTDNYVEVQRVNRVYAVFDNPSTLVKVKPDGTVGRIQNLPDSIVIDNKNELSLDAVNQQWYIDLANKYIGDYLGESRG